MFLRLLNSNSSVVSEYQPCYDDDNNEHSCAEDNPIAAYWVLSSVGLITVIGSSCCLYHMYKHYCSGVTPLEEPLIV